jgi:histidyl-tRNA synthetase
MGDAAPAIALAEELRRGGLRVQFYGDQKKFKQKMAYADKLAVPFAVLLGEDEINEGLCSVKNMKTGEQLKLSAEAAADYIRSCLADNDAPVILEK